MLKWIRSKLRKWLLDDDPSSRVDTIECLIAGAVTRAAIEQACGMKLVVSTGQNSYLIGPEQAVNKKMFWKAWEQRSSGDYVWDDGTKFEPGKQ